MKEGNKGLQEVLRDYSDVSVCGMAYQMKKTKHYFYSFKQSPDV